MIKTICFKAALAIGILIWMIPFLCAATIGLILIGFVWVKNQIESVFNQTFIPSAE